MPSPRTPNLFIIGAPKCGTTAMSHYLAGHPDVFMSEQTGIKEPFYFCSDLQLSHIPKTVRNWKDYTNIFASAPSSVTCIGEASPLYLYSRAAVSNILDACPDARFVVMLRNPVELAASLHNQHAKNGVDVRDFETAWHLQKERRYGRSLPPAFTDGDLLQYGEIAKLGAQMKRLFEQIGRSRVHCIVYDDMKCDAGRSYRRLLQFLGLADDGRSTFAPLNASMRFHWHGLEVALKKIRRFRNHFGLPGGLGIHAAINRFNAIPGRTPLSGQFERELHAYFKEDVALLSDVVGRDFSAWLKTSKT